MKRIISVMLYHIVWMFWEETWNKNEYLLCECGA